MFTGNDFRVTRNLMLPIGGALSLLALSFSQERPPIVELHRDNFDDTLASHEDVLVHFYAPCAPHT